MNQTSRIIAGILFFILSVAAISLIRINPTSTTPTRSTEVRTAGIMERIPQGVIITQEFPAVKDYISGIDLIFTHGGRNNSNSNTLLLLDANYQLLYRMNFSSTMVKEGDFTSFLFDKSVFAGKGNLLRVCLFSPDGAQDNAVSLLFNMKDSIGALYASQADENDLIGSVKKKAREYRGSLIIRTYETEASQFWLMKVFLGLVAMVIACVIIWFSIVRTTLARTRIIPEWVFLIIAIPVSTVFALITPPLQVPDEGSHFYRTYEIAEFNFLKQEHSTPVSILKLDSVFGRLHFMSGQKTSMAEISNHFGTKLEPRKRAATSPPNFTLPYLPQALGVFIGKIFSSSPLTLMYLGRIFNLLISILVMFFAIRIIPQFKWIFLLLALMPKTLFLFGSLSYDSLTISLSFLTIAVFFYYAFACERNLNFKDLAIIAFLVLLLLFCKPPYFLLGLLFFFIPPKKFGHLYKYIMISAGVAVIALLILKVVPATLNYMAAKDTVQQVQSAVAGEELPLFRPDEQIRNILNDIPAYLKLIVKSGFDLHRDYIVESFFGYLGWIDVLLPDMLTYSYLMLILLCALVLSGENVNLGIMKKSLLFLLLVATFIAIQTAMYVYATRPGRDHVFGVQGRYFIPMAPLFFMLFYNKYLNPKLNLLFSLRRSEYKKTKVKAQPVLLQEIVQKEQLFDKSLYLFLILVWSFTLLYSIYITLIRYYNI
jgi:uncharacterized membrane protein